LFEMISRFLNALKHSARHEPHLKPLVTMIVGAPFLGVGILLWSINGKNEMKVTRFGDLAPFLQTETSKPTQVIFAHKSHRAAYKKDPVLEAFRKEIYDYDDFKKRPPQH